MANIPIRIPTGPATRQTRTIISNINKIRDAAVEASFEVQRIANLTPEPGLRDRLLREHIRFLKDIQKTVRSELKLTTDSQLEEANRALRQENRLLKEKEVLHRTSIKRIRDVYKKAGDISKQNEKGISDRANASSRTAFARDKENQTRNKAINDLYVKDAQRVTGEIDKAWQQRNVSTKKRLNEIEETTRRGFREIEAAARPQRLADADISTSQKVANLEKRNQQRRINQTRIFSRNLTRERKKTADAAVRIERERQNKINAITRRFGTNQQRFGVAERQIRSLNLPLEKQNALLTRAAGKFRVVSDTASQSLRRISKRFTELGQVSAIALGPLSGVSSRLSTINALSGNLSLSLAIGTAGIIAFGFGLFKSIQAATKFERAMIGVQKTTDIASVNLRRLGEQLLILGPTIGVSSSALAEIAKTAGQMGVRGVENLRRFTRTVAILVETTDLTAEQAALKLARLLNITRESVSTIGTLGSVIVALGNNFAATEQQIVDYAVDVARASAIFNTTAAQATALGTALAAAGVKSEAGGTAIGRVFAGIDKVVRAGGAGLRQFAEVTGKSVDQISKIFREDASQALVLFLKGLGMVQEQGGSAIEALKNFGLRGIREAKAILPLVNNIDILTRSLALASIETKNATAAEREFARVQESLSKRLEILRESVSSLAVRIGRGFIPVIKQLVTGISTLVQFISKFVIEIEIAVFAISAIYAAVNIATGGFLFWISAAAAAISAIALVGNAVQTTDETIREANDGFARYIDSLTGSSNAVSNALQERITREQGRLEILYKDLDRVRKELQEAREAQFRLGSAGLGDEVIGLGTANRIGESQEAIDKIRESIRKLLVLLDKAEQARADRERKAGRGITTLNDQQISSAGAVLKLRAKYNDLLLAGLEFQGKEALEAAKLQGQVSKIADSLSGLDAKGLLSFARESEIQISKTARADEDARNIRAEVIDQYRKLLIANNSRVQSLKDEQKGIDSTARAEKAATVTRSRVLENLRTVVEAEKLRTRNLNASKGQNLVQNRLLAERNKILKAGGEELLNTVEVQTRLFELESALLTQADKLNKTRDSAIQKQIESIRTNQRELSILERIGSTAERIRRENDDFSTSTELTVTVDDPRRSGRFINIPSMFDGREVSEQEAVRRISYAGFVDPETGRVIESFNTLSEAIKDAQDRSNGLGDSLKNLDGSVGRLDGFRVLNERQIIYNKELDKSRRLLSTVRKEDLPEFNKQLGLNAGTVEELRRQVAELNTNRIIEQTINKERIKYEKDRAEESRKSIELDEKAILLIDRHIAGLELERDALNLSARERFVQNGILNIENKLRSQNRLHLLAQGDAYDRLRKVLESTFDREAQVKAQEKIDKDREKEIERHAQSIQNIYDNAFKSIQNTISSTFEDIFSGVSSFQDFADAVKKIFVKLAAEIATLLVFKPVLQSFLGSAGIGGNNPLSSGGGLLSSLFGGGGSSGGGGIFSSISKGLSNLANFGSLIAPLSSAAALGATSVSGLYGFGLGTAANFGAIGAATGAGVAGAGIGAGLGGLGALGALGPIGLIGGIIALSSLFGSSGDKAPYQDVSERVGRENTLFDRKNQSLVERKGKNYVPINLPASAPSFGTYQTTSPDLPSYADPRRLEQLNKQNERLGHVGRFYTSPNSKGLFRRTDPYEYVGDDEEAFSPIVIESFNRYVREVEEHLRIMADNAREAANALTPVNSSLLDATLKAQEFAKVLTTEFEDVETFNVAFAAFTQNFYTEAERMDYLRNQFTKSFNALGIAIPETREAYRDLVNAQDLTTLTGRHTYAELIKLSGSFVQLEEYSGSASQSIDELAKALSELNKFNEDIQSRTLDLEGKSFEAELIRLGSAQRERLARAQELGADIEAVSKLSQLELGDLEKRRVDAEAKIAAESAAQEAKEAEERARVAKSISDFISGIQSSILSIEDPNAAILAQLEESHQKRIRQAQELGVSLTEVERLGGLEREKALKGINDRIAEDIEGFISGIQSSILSIEDPDAAILAQLEESHQNRIRQAQELGVSLTEVERLGGLEREKALKGINDRIAEDARRVLEEQTNFISGIQSSILSIEDPDAAILAQLEESHQNRIRQAQELGVSLTEVERLGGLEREKALKGINDRIAEDARRVLEEQTNFISGIQSSILSIEDPDAAILAQLEESHQNRIRQAQELGVSLTEVERLGGLEREKALKGINDRIAEDARRVLEEQTNFISGIQSSILSIEDPNAAILAQLEESHQKRIRQAQELGVSLTEVERLGGLEREKALKGINDRIAEDARRLADELSSFNRGVATRTLNLQGRPFDAEGIDLEQSQTERLKRAEDLGGDVEAVNRLNELEIQDLERRRRESAAAAARSRIKAAEDRRQQIDAFIFDVNRSILQLQDPLSAQIFELNKTQEERLRRARELGIDILNVEKLHALERIELVKRTTDQISGIFENALLELTQGGASPLSATDRLSLIRGRFGEARSSFDPLNEKSAAELADAGKSLVNIARENFASGGDFFDIYNDVVDTFRNARIGSTAGPVDESGEERDSLMRSLVDAISSGSSEGNDLSRAVGQEIARGNSLSDLNNQEILALLTGILNALSRIERLEERQLQEA